MLASLRKGWSATRGFIRFWSVDLIHDLRTSAHVRSVCPFDQVPLQNLRNGGFGCPKCGGTEGMPELPGLSSKPPHADAKAADSIDRKMALE